MIAPTVDFRCIEGAIIAAGREQDIELKGAEALLLAAFSSPRTCAQASSYLQEHGFELDEAAIAEMVCVLQSAQVVFEVESDDEYCNSGLWRVARATSYAAHVLNERLGFARSFVTEPRNGDGELMPFYPYAVIHWLKGYDLSSKRALLVTPVPVDWWVEACAHVTIVTHVADGLPPNLSETNVRLVRNLPEAGPFDVVELYHFGDQRPVSAQDVRKAVELVADNGAIILPVPEWHPEPLCILRSTDMIEVNLAGFRPASEAPKGCSIFLTRQFDWPRKTPNEAPMPVGGLPPPEELSRET